jgi:hypothetical protein
MNIKILILRGKEVLSFGSSYQVDVFHFGHYFATQYYCHSYSGSWVKVTENHHENRMHGIHYDSKHPLRRMLALFSSSRTRPDSSDQNILYSQRRSFQVVSANCSSRCDLLRVPGRSEILAEQGHLKEHHG